MCEDYSRSLAASKKKQRPFTFSQSAIPHAESEPVSNATSCLRPAQDKFWSVSQKLSVMEPWIQATLKQPHKLP